MSPKREGQRELAARFQSAVRRGACVCAQDQFIADEHMANILPHVIVRAKQTPRNVSESAGAGATWPSVQTLFGQYEERSTRFLGI